MGTVMQWKQLLAGLEENPGRIDLASGVICLCRTIQNPVEQAGLLTACSALILKAQPLVALQMLRLALILAPRHPLALTYARDIFKRRGRWAAEQRVTELLATLTHATAVSPPPDAVSNMTTQTRANQMGGGAAHDTVESPMVAQPFTPLQNGRSGIAADLFADEPIRFDPEEFNPLHFNLNLSIMTNRQMSLLIQSPLRLRGSNLSRLTLNGLNNLRRVVFRLILLPLKHLKSIHHPSKTLHLRSI